MQNAVHVSVASRTAEGLLGVLEWGRNAGTSARVIVPPVPGEPALFAGALRSPSRPPAKAINLSARGSSRHISAQAATPNPRPPPPVAELMVAQEIQKAAAVVCRLVRSFSWEGDTLAHRPCFESAAREGSSQPSACPLTASSPFSVSTGRRHQQQQIILFL